MADLNNNENNMPEGIDSINELLESVGIAPISEEEENEENEDIFDTLRRLNEVFGAEETEDDASAREFFDSLSSPAQKKEEDDPTELSIEEQLRRAYPNHENE